MASHPPDAGRAKVGRDGGEPAEPPGSAVSWSVPRPILVGALKIAALLMTPLVIVYATAGGLATLAMAMGYVGSLTPALTLRPRYSGVLVLPAAMTGVVAASTAGQAWPAACFVALACLLVAPANVVRSGLLAGIPTIAAVYATLPGNQDPARVGAWMLVGGAIVVVIAGVAGIRSPAVPVGVEPWTAWAHAVAMAVVVGPVVLLLGVVDIPHGYWFAMTLTVVLRPYGAETQSVARQRVVGTTLGAALALGLATVLPTGIALAVAVGLLVLVVANAVMGRYAQQVTFLTPFIVLIGSGGGGTAGVALQRVLATLLGALLAAGIALALWRVDQRRQQT